MDQQQGNEEKFSTYLWWFPSIEPTSELLVQVCLQVHWFDELNRGRDRAAHDPVSNYNIPMAALYHLRVVEEPWYVGIRFFIFFN